jgi:plastocyanin
MVGAVAGIAMLTGGVALFAAERGEGGGEPGLPQVLITAPVGAAGSGFAEETRDVTAPAGEPFQLLFDNRDSQPHNVVIAASDAADAERFLREEPFLGPREQAWDVEPLEEGSYYFFCEVHPTTMTGTLDAAPGAGGPGGDPGGGPLVAAEGLAFDTDQITLPAGVPTTITFENRDASIPHNLSIYRDQAYTDPVYPPQEPFPGPDDRTYEVPPLEPGTLFFRCDVHPTTMEGTVLVEGGGGAEGAQPQEPTGGG